MTFASNAAIILHTLPPIVLLPNFMVYSMTNESAARALYLVASEVFDFQRGLTDTLNLILSAFTALAQYPV